PGTASRPVTPTPTPPDTLPCPYAPTRRSSDLATALVTITVVDNSTVTAADASASTNENTPVTLSVLDNASDSDGDALSISAVTQGAFGTVSTDGTSVTYTPGDPNFHGTDTFTYTASDAAGNSATATVTITVVDNSTVTAA